MIKSLWGAYTAMSTRHLNAKASLYVSLLPSRPPPSLHLPCISTLGGKHFMGLALGWHSIKCIKLSPPFSRLGLADVHPSQRISEGEEAFFFVVVISREKNQKYDKTMSQDLLMFCFLFFFFSFFFLSVNQRCYLTQVPYVISITFDDTKDNQRFFLIARPL